MRLARPVPSADCRRNGFTLHRRKTAAENPASPLAPVLHWQTISNPRGQRLEFHSFDEAYINRLQAGDFRTQEHFSAYFSALIRIKLGSRVNSKEAIEDLRQETFARFFTALRAGKILQPERLGAFVNSICNNVLLEHYRAAGRSTSLDDEEDDKLPAAEFDLIGALGAKETQKKVRTILEKLTDRDRRLLHAVFLEERDKDEVCREFGIDREYLRVLLHRAKQAFKSTYLRHIGENSPESSLA